MYIRTFEGLGQLPPEDRVNELMRQMQPLFQKNFSRNRVTYGPEVGKPVKYRVVADKDFKGEIEKEAEQLAKNIEPSFLKFAPEKVREKLEGWYKVTRQKFPARLQTIDENTRLTRDERAAIFSLLKVFTMEKIRADADKVAAFYSLYAKEMVFPASQIDAGAVAHEMAHAYANKSWHDFIIMMRLRGMKDTDKLDEGMTTLIERIVVKEWYAKQPSSTVLPLARYDATFLNRANEFVTQLGRDLAFEAYFGGWVDYKSNTKPEDTLIIGQRKRKNWRWPWRQTTSSFPTIRFPFISFNWP